MALEEEAVHGARRYEWLEYSTIHIGHRPDRYGPGRATELADSLFTRMGLQVGRVPFEVEVWMRGALELTYGMEPFSMRSGPSPSPIHPCRSRCAHPDRCRQWTS